jgi:hypothetical protein
MTRHPLGEAIARLVARVDQGAASTECVAFRAPAITEVMVARRILQQPGYGAEKSEFAASPVYGKPP